MLGKYGDNLDDVLVIYDDDVLVTIIYDYVLITCWSYDDVLVIY